MIFDTAAKTFVIDADANVVDAIKVFKARSDLAPEVKRKILSDNARALYGL